MNRVAFATSLLCMGAWVSTVCGAPPDRQHIIDQQQQLIGAQKEDDLNRQTVEKLAKQLRDLYGEISTLRITADQLSHLDRVREYRALQFWELLDVTAPLKSPLTESQRAELETFAEAFKDTAKGRFAKELLVEHEAMLRSREAKEMLAKLQLKSTADELSEAQLSQLVKIHKEYSTTDSATVAGQYLKAHYSRRSREKLAESGLFAPEAAERLAGWRLNQAQERYRNKRDATYLRQALADIVEDYPGTQAGQKAGARFVEIQRALNAEAERLQSVRAAEAEQTRFISEYWDAAYPSRTRKRDGVQQ